MLYNLLYHAILICRYRHICVGHKEQSPMNNKLPPKPLKCIVCEEEFYGRRDAKTCGRKCRQRMKYIKDKKVIEESDE